MNVVCALQPDDAVSLSPDILVLPEGTSDDDVARAVAIFPKAVVVAATRAREHMRAQVLVGGINQIDYLKIRSDDRSTGTNAPPRSAVYEGENVVLGVVVCRDIEETEFVGVVLQALRASAKSRKLLCIPADMHGSWFQADPIKGYEGVYVALCNNNTTYPVWRARSLIASPTGERLVTQVNFEPVAATAA